MKLSMYSIRLAAFGIAILMLVTTAQASLLVDFSTLASGQSGWETINGTGSPNGTFSGYDSLAGAGNDITVTASNIAFNRRYDNSGVNDDIPGTTLDAMYGDILFRNNDSATVDVTISGLLAGTFEITTYHLIDSPSPGQFNLIKTDDNGTTTVGNFTMGSYIAPPNLSPFNPTIITFSVTSNGIDDIVLQMDETVASSGGNTGGWYGYNGMEIVVPEPASLALLGLGSVIMLSRKRR